MGHQPHGGVAGGRVRDGVPARELLRLETVYAQAEDVKGFARELGEGLRGRSQHVESGGLDPADLETLRLADPLTIRARPGRELLLDKEGREVFDFADVTPRLLPETVEALAWAIKEQGEPLESEVWARAAYGFEEEEEDYYARRWALRQEDLVQEGLRRVEAQVLEVQEKAERVVERHVARLWDRLRGAMETVSRWGRDLVATWELRREIHRVEREIASATGRAYGGEDLPKEPGVLREMLRERREDLRKAWERSPRAGQGPQIENPPPKADQPKERSR